MPGPRTRAGSLATWPTSAPSHPALIASWNNPQTSLEQNWYVSVFFVCFVTRSLQHRTLVWAVSREIASAKTGIISFIQTELTVIKSSDKKCPVELSKNMLFKDLHDLSYVTLYSNVFIQFTYFSYVTFYNKMCICVGG